MATKTKTYNGIEFIVMDRVCGYNLVSFAKFASKDEAEKELERALCEYVKDDPMLDFWAVEAQLESGETLEITLGAGEGHTPWHCSVIEYSLDGESYYESERTDNYEDYRMIGDIKNLIDEYESKSDEDIADDFDDIWAERFAGAVRMFPEEFTEEEKVQVERIVRAILNNEQ